MSLNNLIEVSAGKSARWQRDAPNRPCARRGRADWQRAGKPAPPTVAGRVRRSRWHRCPTGPRCCGF